MNLIDTTHIDNLERYKIFLDRKKTHQDSEAEKKAQKKHIRNLELWGENKPNYFSPTPNEEIGEPKYQKRLV
jgi:hypothetical protein